MEKIKLDNPKSYREAGDQLLSKISLSDLQLSDTQNFIKNIIPQHLSRTIKGRGFEIRFLDWSLDNNTILPEYICKAHNKTRSVDLNVTMELSMEALKSSGDVVADEGTVILNLTLDKIPIPTAQGRFIINGGNVIMISHLGQRGGLGFGSKKNKSSMYFTTTTDGLINITLNGGKNPTITLASRRDKTISKIYGAYSETPVNIYAILKELDMSSDDIQSIMGNMNTLGEIKAVPISDGKLLDSVLNTRLFLSDRHRLNRTLSYVTRLGGEILDEDLKIDGTIYKSGDKITLAMAEKMQSAGIPHVKVRSNLGRYTVYGNQFVDITRYVEEKDIPEIYRHYITETEYNYYSVYKPELETCLSECKESGIDVKSYLKANQSRILGKTFNKSDIVAFANLFTQKISDPKGFSDKDSLAHKGLVNVSRVFEDLLIERLYGTYGILGKVEEMRNNLRINTGTNSGRLEYKKLNLLDNDTMASKIVKDPYSRLFQRASDLNPIDEASHLRKVSLTKVQGYGGVDPKFSMPQARSIHPSHIGRLCPIESPEGEKVGLMLHLATLAKVNNEGFIEAPFFKIDKEHNKILFDEAIYYTFDEEQYLNRAFSPQIADRTFATVSLIKRGAEIKSIELNPIVAEIDGKQRIVNKVALEQQAKEIFEKSEEADEYSLKMGIKDWFIEDRINTIDSDGKLVEIDVEDIDLITCRGDHILSAATANIPFAEYDDGTRLMMGAAMSKQTEPVMGSQVPLITTSLTDKIGQGTGGVIRSPENGVVKWISANSIVLTPLDSDSDEEIVIPLEMYKISSENTCISNIVRVKKGDIVTKGMVLADTEATQGGELATGTNLLVAYMVWEGYNYEDGIVISDRLQRDDILTSSHIYEYVVRFDKNKDVTLRDYQIAQNDMGIFKSFQEKTEQGDNAGILKIGTKVRAGDTIYVKFTHNDSGYKPKQTTYEDEPGTLIKVSKSENDKDITYTFHFLTQEKIKVGDKLAGRHGNKGCIANIVPQALMPYTEDGRIVDILLTPLGVPSRMNLGQLLEAQLGLILDEVGLTAETESGVKLDIPRVKRITSEYTGDPEGKIQLYDGRTGKPFAAKSLLGVTVINKLKHQSSHKLSARGTGSLSEYTPSGQPTKGKKRNGGQTIGEMEVWAFTADNANACAAELQRFRSDDPNARNYFKNKVVRGKNVENVSNFSKPYKKMTAYLRGMGLKAANKDTEGNEVDVHKDRVFLGRINPRNYVEKDISKLDKEEVVQNAEFRDIFRGRLGITPEAMAEDKKKQDELIKENSKVEWNKISSDLDVFFTYDAEELAEFNKEMEEMEDSYVEDPMMLVDEDGDIISSSDAPTETETGEKVKLSTLGDIYGSSDKDDSEDDDNEDDSEFIPTKPEDITEEQWGNMQNILVDLLLTGGDSDDSERNSEEE